MHNVKKKFRISLMKCHSRRQTELLSVSYRIDIHSIAQPRRINIGRVIIIRIPRQKSAVLSSQMTWDTRTAGVDLLLMTVMRMGAFPRHHVLYIGGRRGRNQGRRESWRHFRTFSSGVRKLRAFWSFVALLQTKASFVTSEFRSSVLKPNLKKVDPI